MNGPLKVYRSKRCKDKTKAKLTEANPITLTSIHTNQTKHQNKME